MIVLNNVWGIIFTPKQFSLTKFIVRLTPSIDIDPFFETNFLISLEASIKKHVDLPIIFFSFTMPVSSTCPETKWPFIF